MRLKIEAARRQLGTALHLFIRDRDPVSVHTLTGAAAEILERYADEQPGQSMTAFVLGQSPDLRRKDWYAMKHQVRNALKHASTRTGTERDDEHLLATFSDRHNASHLFMAWIDYGQVEKQMPVEAQGFIAWFDAAFLQPNGLEAAPDQMPGRLSSKSELSRVIRRACSNKAVMRDARTERRPLVLGWPPT